jgi:transcriptional regulator with XRE-family HTH domain
MVEQIGLKIKKLRKENKDTLKSLAMKIDYDWSNLSKVERGLCGASVDLLSKITEVYNINPNYFFEGLTDAEGKVLAGDDMDKYKFVIDGVQATEEEITAAVRLIRQLRPESE